MPLKNANPSSLENTVKIPMAVAQQQVYDFYDRQLWDYLQKEKGTIGSFWQATRPDAWKDKRVGLIREEMNARIQTYQSVVDSKNIWKQFQTEQLNQINAQLFMTQSDAEKEALSYKVKVLNDSSSFAQYAKKTGQYPQTEESFSISNKSDDKKQVYWTKEQINTVLDERFNTLQALSYQMQKGEPNNQLRTKQKERLEAAELIYFKYYKDKPNDDEENAFIKNISMKQMQFYGESKAFDDLMGSYKKTPEWETVKTFKIQQLEEKHFQKMTERQEALSKLEMGEDISFWSNKAQKALIVAQQAKTLCQAWKNENLTYISKEMSGKKTIYEGALRIETPNGKQIDADLLAQAQQASLTEKEYIVMMHARKEYLQAAQNGNKIEKNPLDISLNENFDFNRYVKQNSAVLNRQMERIDSSGSRNVIKFGTQLAAASVAQAGVRSVQAATVAAAPITLGTSLTATVALEGCAWTASYVAYEASEGAAEEVSNISGKFLNHWTEKDVKGCIQYLQKSQNVHSKKIEEINPQTYQKAIDFALKRAQPNSQQEQVLKLVKEGNGFFAASQQVGLTGCYFEPENLAENAKKYEDARMQKELLDTFKSATATKTEYEMRSKLVQQYEKAKKMGLTDEQLYPSNQVTKNQPQINQPSSLIQTLREKEQNISSEKTLKTEYER